MATKNDFTGIDRKRRSSVSAGAEQAQEIREIERAQAQEIREIERAQAQEKGKYNRLDPRDPAPKEYRFNARMPGIYGVYLNQLAWMNHSSVTVTLQEIIREHMEQHPEVLASIDELNK